MRWVFYALLALNAGYLGWQLRHLEPPAEAAPESDVARAMVNRLLLLSEVDTAELRERRLAPPAPEPDGPGGASGPGAGPPPLAAASAPAAQAPGTVSGAVADRATCFSVGPLADESEVGRMRDWLTSEGGASTLREGERRELSLYWVYFPPLGSREEAVQRVEAMRGEGIRDIYIIPRGDMGNAISLGVYRRRDSLERRLAELRGKGYEPSIAPRYRNTRASWFDVAFARDYHMPTERFGALFPAVEMAPAACTPAQTARVVAREEPPVPANDAAVAPRRTYFYSGANRADPEAAGPGADGDGARDAEPGPPPPGPGEPGAPPAFQVDPVF